MTVKISPRVAAILDTAASPGEAAKLWLAALDGDADSARTLIDRLSKRNRARLVVEIGHAKVVPAVLRAALQAAWTSDHALLLAACPPARLQQLFERARFDTSHLPERMTIWRGTRARMTDAARSLAWSKSRERAAWTALWEGRLGGGRVLPPPRAGKPIVIRAEIDRAHVLAAFTGGGDTEIVIVPPVAAMIDTDDQDELTKLARRAGPLSLRN
jgi:hypothetical protein